MNDLFQLLDCLVVIRRRLRLVLLLRGQPKPKNTMATLTLASRKSGRMLKVSANSPDRLLRTAQFPVTKGQVAVRRVGMDRLPVDGLLKAGDGHFQPLVIVGVAHSRLAKLDPQPKLFQASEN